MRPVFAAARAGAPPDETRQLASTSWLRCPTSRATPAKQHNKLESLPVRAPQLIPIERLWRDEKKPLCANREYPSIEEQAERMLADLDRRLGALSNPESCPPTAGYSTSNVQI